MGFEKDKLKLVIVNRWLFPSEQGGIPMYNEYLVKGLLGRVDLTIISLKNELNEKYYKELNVKTIFLKPINLSFFCRFSKLNWMKNAIRSLSDYMHSYAYAKILRKLDFDYVEFMDIHSEAYVFLLRNKNKNKKVIIRSHTPWGILKPTYNRKEIRGVDSWFAIKRESFCFKQSDLITTPSIDLKNKITEYYNLKSSKIKVLPNLLDTNHFTARQRTKYLDEFVILHIGRFERAKGIVNIVQAFVQFVILNPKSRLVLAGQFRGDAYNECITLLNDNNLISKVDILGFVSYNELPELYANCDLVVVASTIYESFSYTVAQALSCHKPVVASNIGGIPETLGNCGILFDFNSIDDLIHCFHTIDLQSKQFDFDNQLKSFTVDNVITQYLALLD
jgi:glycosyltransferase involved in cell wall biosynthesis